MVSDAIIREMAGKIASRFNPQRVVLFGSYARGEATENSDVDLLVVVEKPAPRGKRSAPIARSGVFPLRRSHSIVVSGRFWLSHQPLSAPNTCPAE